MVGLTKSVASELSPSGIRVNAVAPGSTVTAMTSSLFTGDPNDTEVAAERIGELSPMGKTLEPDDIAGALAYLASDDARYVTGHVLVVDSGYTTAPAGGLFHSMKPAVFREAGRRTKS